MGRTQRQRKRHSSAAASDALGPLYSELHKRGWRNETQLSATDFPQTGRGLCSKKLSFEAGNELIRLPAECLISIATMEADEQFKALFDKELFDKDARISCQALLACYLMHLKHSCSVASSSWSAYLETLPSSYTTPYFCTIPELQCLPEALLERIVAQNRQIREYYAVLKQLMLNKSCADCGQSFCEQLWELPEFKLCYFAVNTRSVYLNARLLPAASKHFQQLLSGDCNLALAPFLDLFNHTHQVQTKAQLLGQDYVLTLQSLPQAKLKPYEQLFISYGALTNFKLLTEYGFYLEQNSQDYFEFSLHDIEQLIAHNKEFSTRDYHCNIFKFIRQHNLNDQMFVHLDDGPSHNLRVVLHLIFKQQAYFPNILNQIAFGTTEQFEQLQPELGYLLNYKIEEYKRFQVALQRLPQLSDSAAVVAGYLKECVQYLYSFIERHGEA
ncbi:CG33230 [Drosophila busckii]|uniref:CG33230 n=1 Tax=Drosophila busckii TaxID=30019 RepID=A0A0M4EJT3_DROBS|nr:SET domain-containing protein 4 [Drosophila busckii]ALC43335.1 CG33230 [Drosophila busckii]